MNDIDIAAKDRRVSPVSPRVARYSPIAGKPKPCESKMPFGAFFARLCGNGQAVRK